MHKLVVCIFALQSWLCLAQSNEVMYALDNSSLSVIDRANSDQKFSDRSFFKTHLWSQPHSALSWLNKPYLFSSKFLNRQDLPILHKNTQSLQRALAISYEKETLAHSVNSVISPKIFLHRLYLKENWQLTSEGHTWAYVGAGITYFEYAGFQSHNQTKLSFSVGLTSRFNINNATELGFDIKARKIEQTGAFTTCPDGFCEQLSNDIFTVDKKVSFYITTKF